MSELTYNLVTVKKLKIESDTVHKVRVEISDGPTLKTRGATHHQTVVCDVFVQECRSDSEDDLLRCALRVAEEIVTRAHAKAVRETL